MTNTANNTIIASARWDNILDLVGSSFQGSWFQVERERLAFFDKAAYIRQNANALDNSLYPDGLIEGFHLLALLDHLVNQVCFVDDPHWSGWNYGFDTVRFVSVVTIDDRLRVRGKVESIESRGDRYLALLNCTIEVEGREKPGAVAQWKVMWTRTTNEG